MLTFNFSSDILKRDWLSINQLFLHTFAPSPKLKNLTNSLKRDVYIYTRRGFKNAKGG